MAEPPRQTDLSDEDPTARADPVPSREKFTVEIGWKAFVLKLTTHTEPQSPTGVAVAASLVTIAGIGCALAVHAMGVSGPAASAGLLLPAIMYGLIVLAVRAIRR